MDLPPEASHYLGKVLRAKPGQSVNLFNDDGQEYTGLINQVGKRSVSVTIVSSQAGLPASPLHTHLGQVMSRGDRMDYAIQKATEMGVNLISPLYSERCEVKLDPKRLSKRLLHWRQIAISASEQSGRSEIPVINPPSTLNDWLHEVKAERKLVLHPHNTVPLKAMVTPASCALLIGPEGGLTNTEVLTAEQQDFQPICLGPRILRTETAPVTALGILQHLWGDY
jgi:16S rRNA (uracil1498-N3)-methyltransferase